MSARRAEVEVMKRRSAAFLEGSRYALRSGLYDLACFLAEQSLQLYLKAVLLEVVGDYPRTHGVRRLLGDLSRVLGSRELEEFAAANRARLIALEDAYLMSRYYAREYEREDAEDMVGLVEELVPLVRRAAGGDPANSLLEVAVERARMLREWRAWAERVAATARELIPGAEVYVIGSAARGDHAGGSDVDILVVSSSVPARPRERAELKASIEERLGLPYYHPLEIHLLRPEEAETFLRRAGGRPLRVG